MDKNLLEKIVEKALSLGADYAEARWHKNNSFSITMRNDKVIGMGKSFREGVGIRVMIAGSLGFSATNDINREGLERALSAAISTARNSSHYYKTPQNLSEERMEEASYSVSQLKKPQNIDVKEKIDYLKHLWENAREGSGVAKLQSLFSSYNENIEEKLVINSDGARIQSRIPRIALFYNIAVKGDGGEGANRWYEYSAAGGAELIKKWKPEERIRAETNLLGRILKEAKKVSPGEYNVILGTEIVGLMAHESCGHPSEADRILGREAAQAGESFIKPEMIGKRIGSEAVTIIDDPTIPNSNGFYLYDDEGVKARPRYLYKNGLINEFLHNRETAYILRTHSNAAARAMDYNSEPIVRMANTYFKPGDYKLDELLEEMKNGLYVKSYMEWNIDDQRWGQRYVGLEAYYIEKGDIKFMVKNPVLEFTTQEVYMKTEAVADNLEFHAGVCGKGEPGQGVPVWFGGPEILVKNLRVR
jgi:TldD protein